MSLPRVASIGRPDRTARTVRDPALGPRDARVIAEVAIAHAASHFFQLALPPLFPWIREAFGLSWSQLGLAMTLFYAVSCVGQAASGFAVDRHGARRVVAAGFALLVLGPCVAAIGTVPMLYAGAALLALGNSVFHPADLSTLNRRVAPARLGHAFSIHAVAGNVGYATAPIAMVAAAATLGWQAALLAAAVLGAAIGGWVLRPQGVFEGPPPTQRAAAAAGARSLPGGFLTTALLLCMAFFVTVNIAMIGLQSFGATLLTQGYAVPVAQATPWLTAFIVAAGAGMLAGGFVAASGLPHGRVAALGTGGAALATAALATLSVPPALAGPLACAAGFAIGLVAPSRDLLVRASAPAAATGRAYGIVYAGVDVGAAIGPALIGAWLDRDRPDAAYATVALALVATAALGLAIGRRVATAEPPHR